MKEKGDRLNIKNNTPPVFFKPISFPFDHYQMSEARVEELMDPNYKYPREKKEHPSVPKPKIEVVLNPNHEVQVLLPPVLNCNSTPEMIGEDVNTQWESREQKSRFAVEIQQLQKQLEDAPEDEGLKKKINDMQTTLIQNDTGLIYWTASRFRYSKRGVDDDVLFNAGALGSLRAIKTYDSSKAAFTTHQVSWIRSCMGEALKEERNMVYIPENKVQILAAVMSGQEKMMQESGKHVCIDEVLDSFEMKNSKRKDVECVMKAWRSTSLDAPVNRDDNLETIGNFIPSNSEVSPEEAAIQSDLIRNVRKIIEEIPLSEYEAAYLSINFDLECFGDIDRQTRAYVKENYRKLKKSAFRKIMSHPEVQKIREAYSY